MKNFTLILKIKDLLSKYSFLSKGKKFENKVFCIFCKIESENYEHIYVCHWLNRKIMKSSSRELCKFFYQIINSQNVQFDAPRWFCFVLRNLWVSNLVNRISWILWAANFVDNDRRCLNEENERAKSSASAEHKIMYLSTREARRPKGPAKLRKILEKRETVLSKWRDGTISVHGIFRAQMIFSGITCLACKVVIRDQKTRLKWSYFIGRI